MHLCMSALSATASTCGRMQHASSCTACRETAKMEQLESAYLVVEAHSRQANIILAKVTADRNCVTL